MELVASRRVGRKFGDGGRRPAVTAASGDAMPPLGHMLNLLRNGKWFCRDAGRVSVLL